MTIYRWRELNSVPNEPGLYAWYYTPEITDYDLASILSQVEQCKKANDVQAATRAIRSFLDERVFQYFQEQPYQAVLHGALKARYEGILEHTPAISEALVERLVADPRRLIYIKRVLESSTPYFASPIYIGMSDRLNRRLTRHKSLIERYADAPDYATHGEPVAGESELRDHTFAREVRARGIPPARLLVAVQVTDTATNEYVDIENILNRIHYPLMGRN